MTVGIYGKAPMRGDFISVHVESQVEEKWHAWIVEGLTRTRDASNDAWNDAYLNAPIWRFALAAGVVNTAPICGIVMPSVDAGGRFFPLAIVVDSTVQPSETPMRGSTPFEYLIQLGPWFDAAEQVALDSLDANVAYETLVGAIDELERLWTECIDGWDGDAAPTVDRGVCTAAAQLGPQLGLAALIGARAGLTENDNVFWATDGVFRSSHVAGMASDQNQQRPTAGFFARCGALHPSDWFTMLNIRAPEASSETMVTAHG